MKNIKTLLLIFFAFITSSSILFSATPQIKSFTSENFKTAKYLEELAIGTNQRTFWDNFQHNAIGFTLAYPGGFNLILETFFTEKIGLRGSMGMLFWSESDNEMQGFQGNFLINLKRTKSFNVNISAGTGFMKTKRIYDLYLLDTTIVRKQLHIYAGPAIDFSFYNIFGEFGLNFYKWEQHDNIEDRIFFSFGYKINL